MSDVANSRERRGGARPPPPEVSSVRNGSGDSYSESSGGWKRTDCKRDGATVSRAGHVTTRQEQRKQTLTGRSDVDLESQTRFSRQVWMRRCCGGKAEALSWQRRDRHQ